MKVGSTTGDPAFATRAALPVLTIFLVCCMLLNGVLHAQETTESDPPAAQAAALPAGDDMEAAAETTAADIQAAVDGAEGDEAEAIVTQTAEETAATRLAETLKKNDKCLRCHNRDKTKLLEDGKEMSIQVHKDAYLTSAHREVSCVSCHRAIGERKHPSKSTNITITSERDYALEMNETCRKCHRQKFTQYKGSVHAAMVAQGSKKAPLCTNCHNPHAAEAVAEDEMLSGFPCANCHANIFNAYRDSVHGQARISGNTIRDSHIQSPMCSDCHQSHEVTALAIGDVLRTTCIGCHENTTLLHNQWLPNAGTHLDIVSCAVCHAPFARHKFDLHLYDNTAQEPVAQKEGAEPLQQQLQAIVAEGGDLDPLEVWKSRGGFGQPGQPVDISLRSRMEVMSGVAAHQIAKKSFAVRTCDSCHMSDTRQSQNVTVSITQPDGRIQSFETDRQILSSVGAVNSISDFYALGGNPNKLLDYMLWLALFAGIAIPVGHFAMGKVIAKAQKLGD